MNAIESHSAVTPRMSNLPAIIDRVNDFEKFMAETECWRIALHPFGKFSNLVAI